MQETEEMRVSAKTKDKALEKAAETLGIDVSKIEYRVVSETKGGFLSFIGRKVEIAVKVPRRGRREQSRADYKESKPKLSDEAVSDLVEDLRAFCQGICTHMCLTDVDVEATLEKDRLILNIQNEDLAQQGMKNSKLPESLEHILRKKPRHLKRELPFRVFVDICGFRQDRESELVGMAKDLSEKVHENRKPIVLNYKNSYDRKIIHMALDKDERVYTRSIGSGANRKLMILPVKKPGDEEAEIN